MGPTVHSRLGASKAYRWLNCPGSVAAEAPFPDTTSPYAEEGTKAHALLEEWLQTGVQPAGAYPADAVDAVRVDAVRVAAEYVLGVRGSAEMALEHRFDLSPLNPPEPMFGTSDVTLWDDATQTLHVIDYKHGSGVVVDVVDNPQTMMYALGAVVEHGKKPQRIITTIIQPRASHPDGPIRSWEFDWDTLVAFKRRLFKGAHATQEPDAPRQVGDWCRFCRAKAVCAAQADHAESVALTEFQADPVAPPAPRDLTPEKIAYVLERAALVRDWLNGVEEHALNLLKAGEDVPGYKLVPGRANRKWKDEAAAAKYLAYKGLRMKQRFTKKLISPAQAEKLLGEDAWRLEDHWEKPEGKPTLARVEDARPALRPGSEFDTLSGDNEA